MPFFIEENKKKLFFKTFIYFTETLRTSTLTNLIYYKAPKNVRPGEATSDRPCIHPSTIYEKLR